MQEGSFRVDANISLRPKGEEEFGTRAEIKNINSFRFLQRAIEFEIERQTDILEDGGEVVQETRLYDADRDETRSMRSKEEANDYRYFPDPDLLPLEIDDAFIAAATADLPELPDAMRHRFMQQFGISDYDAALLTASPVMAAYFETVADGCGDAKLAANWINGALAAALNKAGLDIADSPVSAEHLAGLIARIKDDTISGKIAKQVFEAMWQGEGDADTIIEARGLRQVSDSGALEAMVDQVIADNPTQVEQYRAADPARRKKLSGFFVGQIMKASKGQANPQMVNDLLLAKLASDDA
jgi:aspartyl-tRNA(Asn)/glutamyl-tRNA(Gln) amidotransferase subunit B